MFADKKKANKPLEPTGVSACVLSLDFIFHVRLSVPVPQLVRWA